MSKKEVMFLRVSHEAKAWAEKKAAAMPHMSANIVVEKLLLADKRKAQWGKESRKAKKSTTSTCAA